MGYFDSRYVAPCFPTLGKYNQGRAFVFYQFQRRQRSIALFQNEDEED